MTSCVQLQRRQKQQRRRRRHNFTSVPSLNSPMARVAFSLPLLPTPAPASPGLPTTTSDENVGEGDIGIGDELPLPESDGPGNRTLRGRDNAGRRCLCCPCCRGVGVRRA